MAGKILYSLDIGFDREALPKPGSDADDPIYPLSYGITRVDNTGSNPVAQARRLKVAKTGPTNGILFTLYDLTENNAKTSPVDQMSFFIRFEKSRKSTETDTPTSDERLDTFRIHPGAHSPGRSTVFASKGQEIHFPIWNIWPNGSNRFPENQLKADKKTPWPAGFPLINKGFFYFCMQLEIHIGTERRKYDTDPEMILSANGTPPGGDPDDPKGGQSGG